MHRITKETNDINILLFAYLKKEIGGKERHIHFNALDDKMLQGV